MTFPTSQSRIWVRGRFIDLGRTAKGEENHGLTGTVRFAPSPKVLLSAETRQIINGGPFTVAPAEQDGYFAVHLPATDDPDIVPVGWTYAVTEPTGRVYNITVPLSTPILDASGDPLNGQRVINLIDVVPAPTPSAGTVQLITGRGVESMAIDGAGHLIVTYTDAVTADLGQVVGDATLTTRVDDLEAGQVVQDGRLDTLEGATVEARAYRHTQSSPAALWQITHNLPFIPGGVRVQDQSGQLIEPATITDPLPGITELTFGRPGQGVPVAGTADLS